MINRSLDILNKNTNSQATMAQSVEDETTERTVSGGSLGHYQRFHRNLRTCGSCGRIGK